MSARHLAALGMVLVLALGACTGPDRGPRYEDHSGRGFLGVLNPRGSTDTRCGGSAGSALCGEALHPASRGNGNDDYSYRRRR